MGNFFHLIKVKNVIWVRDDFKSSPPERKIDKSEESKGPSLHEERVTNSCLKEVSEGKKSPLFQMIL